jgi:Asp-tRNA(Asn)/Glu-tRNA(Gln) amidotransferase C subunit
MDTEKLKKIIEMANEAVTGLEGDLKKIAFQTTLDKLLTQNIEPAYRADKMARKVRKTKKTAGLGAGGRKSEEDTTVKEIVGKINRTKYHKIISLDSALDRALYLLLVIRDDLKIDGLNPTQIANLLREVFRIKATKML